MKKRTLNFNLISYITQGRQQSPASAREKNRKNLTSADRLKHRLYSTHEQEHFEFHENDYLKETIRIMKESICYLLATIVILAALSILLFSWNITLRDDGARHMHEYHSQWRN